MLSPELLNFDWLNLFNMFQIYTETPRHPDETDMNVIYVERS